MLSEELIMCIEAVRVLPTPRVAHAAERLYCRFVGIPAAGKLLEALEDDAEVMTAEHLVHLLKGSGDPLARDGVRAGRILAEWRSELDDVAPEVVLELEQHKALEWMVTQLEAIPTPDWPRIAMSLGLSLEVASRVVKRALRSAGSLA